MDVKEFIRREIEGGATQTSVARKTGLSIGTINNLLYSESTKVTLETISKIAYAYGKPVTFFIAEQTLVSTEEPTDRLSEKERQLVGMFRNLDERRQDRIIGVIEDMLLALREFYEREKPGKASEELSYKRRSDD